MQVPRGVVTPWAHPAVEHPLMVGRYPPPPAQHPELAPDSPRAQPKMRAKIITSSAKAREAQAAGVKVRKERYAIFGGDKDIPDLHRRTWDELYANRAFLDPDWRDYYGQRLRDLREHYLPQGGGMPQYAILIDRLAIWDTFAHMLDVRAAEATDGTLEEQAAWERQVVADTRVLEYIKQLQKYTEAEKRVDIVVGEHEFAVIKGMSAIIEHVLEPAEAEKVFRALRLALEGGGITDGFLLPQGDVIDGERAG